MTLSWSDATQARRSRPGARFQRQAGSGIGADRNVANALSWAILACSRYHTIPADPQAQMGADGEDPRLRKGYGGQQDADLIGEADERSN